MTTQRYALLISQRAEAAFFQSTETVAMAELHSLFPHVEAELQSFGEMRFLTFEAATGDAEALARLACAQGLFLVHDQGFEPLASGEGFHLHPDFVWGEKYRGKTNETLTQLLLNVALSHLDGEATRVLDPMCGRGTTLFWAMRYGMDSIGVEQDGAVLNEVKRAVKKWTKLHRQKHKLAEGWVQKSNRKGEGKFLEMSAEGRSLRLIVGETQRSDDYLHRKPVDIIATDIPYGIQHMGTKSGRNPLDVLQDAAPVWARCLRPGGVMAIAYNAYMPKPQAMSAAFEGLGLTQIDNDFSHRMSESILREVAVFKKTQA
jgi:SAM-dependent methyltransferase